MKMVKSLLLGSAAGIVAISGAQAADLPVKAKAVEYVKVCSVYGAGFFYVPGTDTCIKIGGYMRAEWGINAAGGSHAPYINGVNGRDTRETPSYGSRVRAVTSFDVRTQTEYGTLRAYLRGGWELNSTDPNYRGTQYFDRGMIQFAGLTVGKTQSFFAFYANALNYTTLIGGGQFDVGTNLLAYTAQFAGGFSATISLEENNFARAGLQNATPVIGTPLAISALPGTSSNPTWGNYGGQDWPDIVANLRVDQPWGSAQIAGAIHQVKGLYLGSTLLTPSAGQEVGFAVQGGVKFNLPWAQGDELWIQGTYTQGATNYLGFNPFVHTSGQIAMYRGGFPVNLGGNGSVGLGWFLDGAYNGTGIELTEGWSIMVAAQHYWTPALRTSVFGHYTALNWGDAGNTMMCNSPGVGVTATPGTGAVGSAASLTTCNFDMAVWQVGSRTVWSPVRNLDIGVEVLYTKFDQNHVGTWNLGQSGARPAGRYVASDQDTWSGFLRFQKNFWP